MSLIRPMLLSTSQIFITSYASGIQTTASHSFVWQPSSPCAPNKVNPALLRPSPRDDICRRRPITANSWEALPPAPLMCETPPNAASRSPRTGPHLSACRDERRLLIWSSRSPVPWGTFSRAAPLRRSASRAGRVKRIEIGKLSAVWHEIKSEDSQWRAQQTKLGSTDRQRQQQQQQRQQQQQQ